LAYNNGIPKGVKELTKVTAKYQITIPIKVRKELGIVPGTEVDIAKEGKRYVLIADPVRTVRAKWCGKFKDGRSTMNYIDEVRGTVD
jgi:AbrB family looped-hinge helix DNA binding protein